MHKPDKSLHNGFTIHFQNIINHLTHYVCQLHMVELT